MNWDNVEKELEIILKAIKCSSAGKPCFGQEKAAAALMGRIKAGGAILADEVGLGKTRVALMVMQAAMNAGGTVAAVVPPGLLYQWENEYNEFAASLKEGLTLLNANGKNGQFPKGKPVKIRSYWNLFQQDTSFFPLNRRKDWLLISHNFGFLQRVSHNTDTWKIELPAIVRALHESESAHGNNLWCRFLKRFDQRPGTFIRQSARRREEKWNKRVLGASSFLLKNKNKFSSELEQFLFKDMICPDDRWGNGISAARNTFKKGGNGRKAIHEMIGMLLGPVDLLVIDEAHKSREALPPESDVSGNRRLTSLIEEIIYFRNRNSRRICLTATPIELGASQWKALLQRTGVNWNDRELAFLTDFENALHKANNSPDQEELLDQLIQASTVFQEKLSSKMIRRRRINQPEHSELLNGIKFDGAHPHRTMDLLEIDPSRLSSGWRKAVLSLEGLSWAAKGSDSAYADKFMACRYASAMMDLDKDDAKNETEAGGCSPKNAKIQRARFWRQLAAMHAGTDDHAGPKLITHPRVQATADYIEACLKDNQEKILVFGRFTKPMEALRDELNIRYVLRRLERGLPSTRMRLDIPTLFRASQRLSSQNGSRSKHFMPFNSPWQTEAELADACQNARNEYRKIQFRLRQWFSNDKLLTILPGDCCFNKMKTDNEVRLNAVFNRFRGELLEDLLDSGNYSFILQEAAFHGYDRAEGGREYELCKSKIIKICADYIRGAYDQNITGPDQETTQWEGDISFRETDMMGDQLTPDHLYSAMDISESEETERTLPRSAYCRLMDGHMSMSTRRIVQERFNRKGSFPRVLIAQSAVGREGLNLHKACRHLILFHPEWNPAVVEQEIGRVDRIRSLWNELADDWQKQHRKHHAGSEKDFPKIKIDFVVFMGTYDEYQFHVLDNRRKSLEAQLFGSLLDEESMDRVSEAYRERLKQAAPDFEPR